MRQFQANPCKLINHNKLDIVIIVSSTSDVLIKRSDKDRLKYALHCD